MDEASLIKYTMRRFDTLGRRFGSVGVENTGGCYCPIIGSTSSVIPFTQSTGEEEVYS